MEHSFSVLRARLREYLVVSPFSFRANTTVGIGGNAPIAVYPRNEEEFVALLRLLAGEDVPYLILGNGSNVLASDAGFDGVVVAVSRVDAVEVRGESVRASCGAPVSKLIRVAAENGLGGIAFMAGIPATVGGAVFMNAGAGGHFIAERLDSVTAYGKSVFRLPAEACGFSYKHSAFMENGTAIVSAEFQLAAMPPTAIEEEIGLARLARSPLPCGRSMGCVFKNPPGLSAGELIDRAGLKGAQCGDAYVSSRHANFILNGGNATSRDVRELIERMREGVYRRFGVCLEEEIRYIGE